MIIFLGFQVKRVAFLLLNIFCAGKYEEFSLASYCLEHINNILIHEVEDVRLLPSELLSTKPVLVGNPSSWLCTIRSRGR